MSEFDQVDSRKNQPANGDVNLEQCDGFDASHRASSACISAKRRGDPDCLGQIDRAKSRRAYPDWAQRRNVRPPSYEIAKRNLEAERGPYCSIDVSDQDNAQGGSDRTLRARQQPARRHQPEQPYCEPHRSVIPAAAPHRGRARE